MPSADDKSTPNGSRRFTNATLRKSTSKNSSKKWEGPMDKSDSRNSRWADGTASPWDEENRGSRRWEPLRVAAPEPAESGAEAATTTEASGASTSGVMGLFAKAGLRRKQS